MKYIDEYRNKELALGLIQKIHDISTKAVNIMEICGGQTHTILKYNIEESLPEKISMIHGPGCPVCVSPIGIIDKAISLASRKEIIFTSYGDMLRVPGSDRDLLSIKAEGGDVRMVYSPLDALKISEENPTKKIVFFGIGFETTAPANAKSILEAKRRNLKNYFLLNSHMLVPTAITALLSKNSVKIRGILAAGHVCTIMGLEEYELISQKFHIPIVATGFEPVDILSGIYMLINQIEENRFEVENQYSRVISKTGNSQAREIINEIFAIEDREWRGIGIIPQSGLKIKEKYAEFDAENIFEFETSPPTEKNLTPNPSPQERGARKEEFNLKSPLTVERGRREVLNYCIAGEILQGIKKPNECECFGTSCNQEHPIGAPMVSSEGACSAYYRYKKINNSQFTIHNY